MNDIQKAIQGERNAQRVRIYGGLSNQHEVQKDEDAIRKGAEDEENPFDKAAEDAEFFVDGDENVEKSDVMDALSYQGDVKISKTGKQIKDQIDNILLPELIASLEVKKKEADEKIKDCGNAPIKEPSRCWTGGIKMDCSYKMYDWEETYVPRKESVAMDTFSAEDAEEKSKRLNKPETEEQAIARREYNDIVRAIYNIKVDIKACDILKELKDKTEYELTPKQFITFRF